MKDYEYQAYVCNNIVYSTLLNLKASGVPAEDIQVMLDCIGKALVTMSIENKPIDFYMKNVEDFITGNRRRELSEDEIAALFERLPKIEKDNAPTATNTSLEIAQKSIELGRSLGRTEERVKSERSQGKWVKIFENPFTNGYVCPFCGHKIQVTEQFLPQVTECEVCGAELNGEGE